MRKLSEKIIALEAKQKTASRRITTHTLDRFIRRSATQDLMLMDSLCEFIIEDIQIHGLSDRDKAQIRDEFDSIFGGLTDYLQKLLKFLSEWYKDSSVSPKFDHAMPSLVLQSEISQNVVETPEIGLKFKKEMIDTIIKNLGKKASFILESSISRIAEILEKAHKENDLRRLLNAILGEDFLRIELETSGFTRSIDQELSEEEFIKSALSRMSRILEKGYESVKAILGSADDLKKLERFYKHMYEKTGRDYKSMDDGLRNRLIGKYFDTLMEFGGGGRQSDVLDELVEIILPDASLGRMGIGAKIDKIMVFWKEAEEINEAIQSSGLTITREVEKDFQALDRFLLSLFQNAINDLFLPFFDFRAYIEYLFDNLAIMAEILHQRRAMGDEFARKRITVLFKDVMDRSISLLGDRPLEVLSFVLAMILRKSQRNLMMEMIDEPSPIHLRFGCPKKPIIDYLNTMIGYEWIIAEYMTEKYLEEKAKKVAALEEVKKGKKKVDVKTQPEIIQITFELLYRATTRFTVAMGATGTSLLLGPQAEQEIREALLFMLRESDTLTLLDQEFDWLGEALTISNELTKLFEGTGFESDVYRLLTKARTTHISETIKVPLATSTARDLTNLLNLVIYVQKVKPYLKGDIFQISTLLSGFRSTIKSYDRQGKLRTKEFLDELLTFGRNFSFLYSRFEGFGPILNSVFEGYTASSLQQDGEAAIHKIRTSGKTITPFSQLLAALGGEIMFGTRSYLSDPQIRRLKDSMLETIKRIIDFISLCGKL